MADNLFEELKDVLQDFKDFLDENVPTIKPAIQAIAGLIPQINDLIDLLAGLIGDLKSEIEGLDVGDIPGLEETAQFTAQVKALLAETKRLLPEQAGTIADIEQVADVVTGLPSLDEVKAEILALSDAIIAHLNSLKA